MTESEWLKSTDPKAMLKFVRDHGSYSERKLWLFACACCDRIQHLFQDAQSRSAIAALGRAADGQADMEELRQAVRDAGRATGTLIRAVCVPILGVEEFQRMSRQARTGPDPFDLMAQYDPGVNAAWAVEYSLRSADPEFKAWRLRGGADPADLIALAARLAVQAVALRRAPGGPPQEAVFREAMGPEMAAQADLLRDLFGPLPFRPAMLPPSVRIWNDGFIVKLATAIYEEWLLPEGTLDPQRLAVLADALEEAGVTDPGILGHLRQQGAVHVKGCWCLDCILGKG